MNISELVEYINESALSEDTQKDRSLQKIFVKFYELKDKNINRALIELDRELSYYQFDHQFVEPKFVSKIRSEIQRINVQKNTAGTMAFMTPIWFGR